MHSKVAIWTPVDADPLLRDAIANEQQEEALVTRDTAIDARAGGATARTQ